MRDWMDFNGDGKLDGAERMFAEEMLCGSRENILHYLEMPEILQIQVRMTI